MKDTKNINNNKRVSLIMKNSHGIEDRWKIKCLKFNPQYIVFIIYCLFICFPISIYSSSNGKSSVKYIAGQAVPPHAHRYPDELPYTYEYEPTMKEKSKDILSDGSDDSNISWRRHKLQITINLQSTSELRLIEIVAPKPTIWYRLDEIHVSLDDGSGIFSTPVIIKAYGETPMQTKKVIDETCKKYFYRIENSGKACRVRIIAKGKAHMSISEVRICGKPI